MKDKPKRTSRLVPIGALMAVGGAAVLVWWPASSVESYDGLFKLLGGLFFIGVGITLFLLGLAITVMRRKNARHWDSLD